MYKFYKEEIKEDKKLREIMEFIKDKGFTEKYTWEELE